MKPDDNNIDELLIDYALGELDADETTRVELLLAERPELMREARALKRTVSRLGVSMIMPPPRLVSRTRHAAYEARTKRRGILTAALRRPVTAAAAGLVAAALVVALVGPSLWSGKAPDQPPRIGQAASLPSELKAFLEQNLEYMRALTRGEVPAVEDFSKPAAQAMLLLEKQSLAPPQRVMLEDIEAVWRRGYDRFSAAGHLSDETLAELKELVTSKRLVERIAAMLAEEEGGR